MKNINKYIYALFISVGLFGVLQLTGCKEDDIEKYKFKTNALWFEAEGAYDKTNSRYPRIDTVEISATFFPGIETYTHKFKVNLIGNLLTSPQTYKVAIVDSLTDVNALKYIQAEKNPTFKSGVISDSLNIVFTFKNLPENFRGRVVYELTKSDFFNTGFKTHNRITIWLNNMTSQPTWWNKDIRNIYLGDYSAKKFKEFVSFTGITSLEFVSAFEKRKSCLEFKEYVTKNKIMDIDSNGIEFPMVIPIF